MKIEYVCETWGTAGHRQYPRGRVPNHFFCSVPCQNEWQKTRQDIREKNRNPQFRAKVSAGLKRRKQILGNDYHSVAAKRKIGEATRQRWESYSFERREQLIRVLRANAQHRRTYKRYDYEWQLISKGLREGKRCSRCQTTEGLTVHHIIPVRAGGSREPQNLVVLCRSCHPQVEKQTRILYEVLPDYEILQLLIRERLHQCL